MSLLYIWGAPGSGKSTLVRELTAGTLGMPARAGGIAVIQYVNGVLELGADRDTFRGTDALAMNAIGAAIPLVAAEAGPIMAEGDRLAVNRFFEQARTWHNLELVFVDAPDDVLEARRAQRGTGQNESWARGRATKARRLASEWAPTILDGRKPVAELVDDLRAASSVAALFEEA